jgi:putative transcriptional regulator
MITHRPPEELLLGYATGSLPEPIALVVASHAAMCADTAAEIRRLERVGGTLLDDIAPAALKAGALDRALASLDIDPAAAGIAVAPHPAATPETRALLPAPVWPYIKGDLGNLSWRRRAAGIETAELIGDSAKRSAFLVRVQAGHALPRHTHRGTELTLVLTGAYRDGPLNFGRGDFQAADPSIDHQPANPGGVECICLVAIDAPIWFTGPIGRLANPFVKL